MKASRDYSKIKAANDGELLIKTADGLKPIELGELIYQDKRLYDIIAEWENLKKVEGKLKQKLSYKNYPTSNLYESVRVAGLVDFNKIQKRKKLKNKLKEINLW